MTTLKNRQGFTLIELLIVVVIIGILAAIAIPRFASTKGKAFDAAAKTDLRNAMTAQEAYYADAQSYASDTCTGPTACTTLDVQPSDQVTLTATATGNAYTMTASHAGSPNTYCVNSNTGSIEAAATC